jgi:hypothetical protein
MAVAMELQCCFLLRVRSLAPKIMDADLSQPVNIVFWIVCLLKTIRTSRYSQTPMLRTHSSEPEML